MVLIEIIVMTYNQEKYIEKALMSILSQRIDIPFHIIVHDDCSNDGTYEILSKYKEKYPDTITIIHQKERKFLIDGFNGMLYKYVVPKIKSKYIAYCDGDDYWIDEYKLQKQYDFMESHQEYSMCFHSAYQLRNNDDFSSKWFIGDERDFGIEDFINDKPGTIVATSSIFLKSEVFVEYPHWRREFPVEDIPLYILASLRGKVHRIKDIMCVYRQFAVGSWSFQNRNNKERIVKHLKEYKAAITLFNYETNKKFDSLVTNQIESLDFRIALANDDYKTVFNKRNKRFLKRLPLKQRISLMLQYKHPKLFKLLRKNH